jgi:PKD repeat protein
MKKALLIQFLVMLGFGLKAQLAEPCGTTEIYNKLLAEHPERKARIDAFNKAAAEVDSILYNQRYKRTAKSTGNAKANALLETQGTVYTIPVVFHILHMGGAENISDAQIYNGIQCLNEDFSATTPDTVLTHPPFRGLEADTRIRFQLATIDPDGNCTNGIVRHYDPNTNWYRWDGGPMSIVPAYTWDPSKYYNIYVVKSFTNAPNLAGYSSFPGGGVPAYDITVILNTYIGRIQTSASFASHTLSHETGHFLNLYHIWDCCSSIGAVGCSGDDEVSDTPVTMGHSSLNCPTGTANQVCVPGVEENPNNFMDYSYCYTMFTEGQATRMRFTLMNDPDRSNLVSGSNLIATGVSNPQICAPAADFNYDKEDLCAGSSVTFSDYSANAHPTSWAWSFPGGTPSSSVDSMPVVTYSSPGIYSATYTAGTSAGTGSITKNNIITVHAATAAVQGAYAESFESITVPNADWTIDNSNGGVGWMQTNTASSSGSYCMKIDNSQNTPNSTEVFYTPSYNLNAINAASPPVSFTFRLAYQQSTSGATERLQVFSSTNCGQTWNQRYSKSGNTLATVSGTGNGIPFLPISSQWRTETVSVAAIQSQSNVMFKFVFTADADSADMNNIYIDDINISTNPVGFSSALMAAVGMNLFPNPGHGTVHVTFDLTEKQVVKLELLDLLGRTIEVAVNEELNQGTHEYMLGNAQKIAPGIYLAKLSVNGMTCTQKIIVE